ncbi:mycofactocin biosynthesis glycosyltransferase MftF [Halobacterium wangiae]|uniref:mycofactocin biosynthesis glycosyltransferase MftF n=1 Tax=Halobacterium wangiae TaxID=2902623 RepID=UPI001E3C4488|nr:mycofactocin biosynthesis glycosyltransferase MftF [Halobacterium wangiae]
MSAPAQVERRGEYRLRDSAAIVGSVLVSTQPLVATGLNDAAVDLLATLDDEAYRSPATVAAETTYGVDAVVDLFKRLHERGFLAWRPGRDPSFQPPVSVVVTVRDDREQLLACLDALAALDYPDYEVVVVDDGSTDGTREAAAGHTLAVQGRIRVVQVGSADDPLGIGASRNRGVEAATHDIVAFTDADCRPTAGWLADLVPCLAGHDLIGGRVRPAGDSTASAYEGVASSLDMGAYGSRVDPHGDTPYLPTANLVGRRAVFEAAPFPDRDVAEDVDVCWRALAAGFDAVYTPTGVVHHDYRRSHGDLAGRRSTYGASEALLASEYGRQGTRVRVPLDALLVVVLAVAGLLSPGVTGTVALGAAGLFGGAGLLARLATTLRQYRRLQSVVSVRDVVRSRGREAVSTVYALSREVTRYYSGPVLVVALLAWFVAPTVGLALGASLALAALLPLVVEYAVHRPGGSFVGYAGYYLADQAGYQYGVYRGAFGHRTLAHLDPTGRFRLSGPGAGRLTSARTGAVPSSNVGSERNRLQ